jgi:hypothetical protein
VIKGERDKRREKENRREDVEESRMGWIGQETREE